MNWSKAKTVLIIIFLLTDIFLASTIYSSDKNEKNIPEEVITSSIKVLNEHNISIKRDIIPKKKVALPYFEATNVITDYEVFAKQILGDSAALSEGNCYTSESGTIYYSGDSFTFKPSNNVKLSGTDLKQSVLNYLKGFGFVFGNSSVIISRYNGGNRLQINENIKNLPVFSSKINVEIKDGNIRLISGKWFNIKDSLRSQDNELKSVTSTLIDFLSVYNEILPFEITSIELGYTIFEDKTYHKTATIIPVQKITTSNGKEYYLDSRNTD